MNKTVCKNCGYQFEGNFCTQCGQPARINRIDSRYLAGEISEQIFQVDKGFFYTAFELFRRPGQTIRNYIEGKRKRYFKPLAYILLTSTLYVFVSYLVDINTYSKEIVSGLIEGLFKDDYQNNPGITSMLNWLSNNNAFILLLSLPFFSLGSYIAFFKSGYNYFEHIVLNVYITGQQMIIYLLLSVIIQEDTVTEFIPLLVGVIYNFWAYFQIFSTKRSISKIILTLFTYILFGLQFFLFIFLSIILF